MTTQTITLQAPLTQREAEQNPAAYRRLIEALTVQREFETAMRQIPVLDTTAHRERLIARLREGERQITGEIERLQEMQRTTVNILRNALEQTEREVAGLRRDGIDLRQRVTVLEADLAHTQSLLHQAQAQNAANAHAASQCRDSGSDCVIS